MPGQRVATLEIELAMATGGAVSDLSRFGGVVDKVSAQAIRDLDQIDAAMKGVGGMAEPSAQMVAFAEETARTAVSVVRDRNRIEKQIEGTISALDREAAALGRTKDEMRDAKVVALALTAANLGLTDAVDRLQVAARQRQLAADAVSEEKAVAVQHAATEAASERSRAEAGVIVELRERAQLEDALHRNFGVGQASAAQSGATFSALAERERELDLAEKQTQAEQALIAAQRQQNNQLAERAQIEAALARTMGTNRPSATDAGATYSALAARAAEDEARAHDLAAAAVKRDADEHARLAALVRGSHDAQVADAAAAERLRETTDPLYAATKRLNEEIAESTRLYHQGATAPAEYARQQQVLTGRLQEVGAQHVASARSATGNAFALKQVAVQIPDITQGLLTGQKPMQVFLQQGGQIAQIGMMAEGGLKRLALQVGLLSLRFTPLIVAAGLGWGAIKLFQSRVEDSKELTHFRDNLGLTHKEMLKLSDGTETAGGKIKTLGDVTVTTGDVIAGLWQTIKDTAKPPIGDWSGFTDGAVDAFQKVLDAWGVVSAGITAGIYGTVNAAKVIWQNFATSVGDVFYQAVNIAIGAMNKLVEAGTNILNGFVHAANRVPGVDIHDLQPAQIAEVGNPYAGAASEKAAAAATAALRDGYTNAYADATKADAAFWKQVGNNAKQSAKDRLTEEADAIKANRTPKKVPVDHHAEQLARDAEATERQIANLYKLGDAYADSGAAALVAEAQLKAESKAIRARADVDAAVAREVRREIAQRVSDAEKASAATRDQARIQTEVNALVADGNIPAEQAADLVRQRVAELPLLAALEVAQQRGYKAEIDRATKALKDQRQAQVDAKAAATGSFYSQADVTGDRRLADLREEQRLVGATNDERVRAMATMQATRDIEAAGQQLGTTYADNYIAKQVEIAVQGLRNTEAQDAYNDSLTETADRWDIIASKVQSAGQGMADAFGTAGRAIGDLASVYANYQASRARADAEHQKALKDADGDVGRTARENEMFALRSAGAQVTAYGDIAAAAKNFFKEHSVGYKAMETAEKAFRAVQMAIAIKSMLKQIGLIGTHVAAKVVGDATMAASDTVRAGVEQSNSIATTAVKAVEAVVNAIKSLPFPLNLAAGAATAAAIAALGVSIVGGFGGGKSTLPKANDGTGTVLGDASAKSDSIKNAISDLKEVDLLTNTFSRQMAASLKSIDSQIGNVAAVIVRGGDINASSGVTEGFQTNAIGSVLSKIPVIGNLLGSLFGSKTTVIGSGLYGGAQSVGDILSGGFDAQTYSDIEKKKKFFGITTSTKTSTQYAAADAGLENQFTLILKSFNDAIAAAAGPLGESTDAIQQRLNGFVVNIGKIDLKALTGTEIQEKLEAIFGAAADGMANAAFPGIAQFQKVGEGTFETLVRVASTLEAVGTSLDLLGTRAQDMGIAAKLGLADQFDSISDLTSAADAYFQGFYSKEEQAAAKTAQLGKVFSSLGVTMPDTLASFRALVEAQDLTSASGQATYATLLKLAPAFADLQSAMDGAKSAADIASEREDLQRQLLELHGDTAAIRALDLAKLDASNRGLQEQVWAVKDAQDAADAAKQLRDAWTSVGDSIMDEVKRIRGLSDASGGNTFASLMGSFNAATAAARAGDQEAAKSLPQLSKALLDAAALQATSRQELDRIQAQTAASLEETYGSINAFAGVTTTATATVLSTVASAILPLAAPSNSNADIVAELQALRAEVAELRRDNNLGHAATSNSAAKVARTLDNVTADSGGQAITLAAAA